MAYNGSEEAGERTPLLLETQTGSFVENVETSETCCDTVRNSISSYCKCFHSQIVWSELFYSTGNIHVYMSRPAIHSYRLCDIIDRRPRKRNWKPLT